MPCMPFINKKLSLPFMFILQLGEFDGNQPQEDVETILEGSGEAQDTNMDIEKPLVVGYAANEEALKSFFSSKPNHENAPKEFTKSDEPEHGLPEYTFHHPFDSHPPGGNEEQNRNHGQTEDRFQRVPFHQQFGGGPYHSNHPIEFDNKQPMNSKGNNLVHQKMYQIHRPITYERNGPRETFQWHRKIYRRPQSWGWHQPWHGHQYHSLQAFPHENVYMPHNGRGMGCIYHIIHTVTVNPDKVRADGDASDKNKDQHVGENPMNSWTDDQLPMESNATITDSNTEVKNSTSLVTGSENSTQAEDTGTSQETNDTMDEKNMRDFPQGQKNDKDKNKSVLGIIHSIHGYRPGDVQALPYIHGENFIPFHEIYGGTDNHRQQFEGRRRINFGPLQFDGEQRNRYPFRDNNVPPSGGNQQFFNPQSFPQDYFPGSQSEVRSPAGLHNRPHMDYNRRNNGHYIHGY